MSEESRSRITEAVDAATEETELEALVEVLGNETAQRAAHAHMVPEFVWSLQTRGATA